MQENALTVAALNKFNTLNYVKKTVFLYLLLKVNGKDAFSLSLLD